MFKSVKKWFADRREQKEKLELSFDYHIFKFCKEWNRYSKWINGEPVQLQAGLKSNQHPPYMNVHQTLCTLFESYIRHHYSIAKMGHVKKTILSKYRNDAQSRWSEFLNAACGSSYTPFYIRDRINDAEYTITTNPLRVEFTKLVQEYYNPVTKTINVHMVEREFTKFSEELKEMNDKHNEECTPVIDLDKGEVYMMEDDRIAQVVAFADQNKRFAIVRYSDLTELFTVPDTSFKYLIGN